MSKLAGYITFISIIILLCTLFGLTSGSSLVAFLMNPQNYAGSDLYRMIGLMVIIFTAALAASLFISGSFKIDFVVLANVGMISMFLALANELLSIFNALSGGTLVVSFRLLVSVFIISPLFYMYAMSVIEWWRGVS
jgi:hypothetical protein